MYVARISKIYSGNTFLKGETELIKQLDITNFGPIKSLSVSPNNKNVYIIGPNGTGKSHILRAISLVCTGRHGKSNTNDSLIGPYAKDFEIRLELDDGSVITRTSKTASLELANGSKYKKVTDVMEHLPFDPILFYNAAFIKQGKINEIFEKDVGKGVIEKLVSLVLDNKILADGYKELLAKEKETKAVTTSIQAVIDDLSTTDFKTQIIEQQTKLKEYDDKIEKVQSMLGNITVDILNTQKTNWEKIERINNELSFCQNQLNLQTSVEEPTESIEELQKQKQTYEQYKKIEEQEKLLKEELSKFENAVMVLTELKEFFGLDSTLVKATHTVEELNNISSKKIELFNYLTTTDFTNMNNATMLLDFNKKYGHIDANSIALEKEKFARIQSIIQPHVDVVKYLKQYSATSDTVENILIKKIEADKQNIENINKQKTELGEIVEVDEQKIIKLAEDWKDFKNYIQVSDNLNKNINKLIKEQELITQNITMTKADIETYEQYANDIRGLLDLKNTTQSMVNMLLTNQEKLNNNITRKIEAEQQANEVIYWKGILKDMPGKLRHALLQPVAYHLNKDFQELFSFTLGGVTIDWNNMDIVIGDMIIDQLSGAQEVALGLTMHLALLKAMGEQVPIMLIDEPTQFMDTVHINEVKTYLNYLGKQTQMWICTHEDQIVDNVNSIIINTANL